jgi:hypothetical protein
MSCIEYVSIVIYTSQFNGIFMGRNDYQQWRREELRAGGGISKNGRKVWSKAIALESSRNWMGVM